MNVKGWYQDNIPRVLQTLALFCICMSITFLYGGPSLSEDNYNYGVEEMHVYNQELFPDNINVAEIDWSPRLYANLFMAGMIRIMDTDWYTAAMILIRINYILYAIACTIFVKRLWDKQDVLGCIVLNVCCMSGSLYSLAFKLNGAADVFLGTAIPLALIAIGLVIGEKRNWNVAWIFLAMSEMMHVHEGIWAGCIVGIIWLVSCLVSKKVLWKHILTLPVYIVSVLLVVVPSLIHTRTVNDSLWNEIYVFIRTPHHLLPSAWGSENIAISGFLVAGALYILFIQKASKIRKTELATLIVLWCLLLVAEYLSTDIFSISIVVTMYVTKCFKYITWIAALVYIKNGAEYIDQKKYIQGLTLMGIALFPYENWGGILGLIAFAVLTGGFFASQKGKLRLGFLGNKLSWIIILMAVLLRVYYSVGIRKTVFAVVVISLMAVYPVMAQRVQERPLSKLICCIGLVCCILLASVDFIYTKDSNGIHMISGEDYVKNSVGGALYELAKEFRDATDSDAAFLADPDSRDSNGFQLISQRSCYAVYKNTPSSKSAVIEWYQRIENVRKMGDCTAKELSGLLDEIGLEYVLVTADRFKFLEESGMFISTVKNESFGMYRLKQ